MEAVVVAAAVGIPNKQMLCKYVYVCVQASIPGGV
jgi:hypothetical protein